MKATVIKFPLERRAKQILNELLDADQLDMSMLVMHLDILNDIALDETCKEDAQRAIDHYCIANGLDPNSFELYWAFEATIVTIAE